MGIVSKIQGGDNNTLKVYDEGNIGVSIHQHPPINERGKVALPYRERFSNNAGVVNMNVDGSTTPVEFNIDAQEEFNLFIKTIFIEIEDTGTLSLNKFGSASALTNGVEWIYFKQQLGEYSLHEGIKTNKEFIRLGIDTHGIGTGTEAYLADVSGGGTTKSYFPIIDLGEMYGLQYGVRLQKGSRDKLIFRINDDLTSLTTFDAIAYGIRIE